MIENDKLGRLASVPNMLFGLPNTQTLTKKTLVNVSLCTSTTWISHKTMGGDAKKLGILKTPAISNPSSESES